MTTLLFAFFSTFMMPTALADDCGPGEDCDVAQELGAALDEESPKAEKPSLFSKIGGFFNGVKQQFAPNEEERAALDFVRSMLEPEKLGGDDRTFNQNDIDRIIDALIQDPAVQQQIHQGIRDEAAKKVAEAPRLFQGITRRIANKRLTPGTRAYQRHYNDYWCQGVDQARGQIREQLTEALGAEGISPLPGQQTSTIQRELTLAELERFQEATALIKSYGDRVSSKLGFEVGGGDMKHGLSQSMIDGILKRFP